MQMFDARRKYVRNVTKGNVILKETQYSRVTENYLQSIEKLVRLLEDVRKRRSIRSFSNGISIQRLRCRRARGKGDSNPSECESTRGLKRIDRLTIDVSERKSWNDASDPIHGPTPRWKKDCDEKQEGKKGKGKGRERERCAKQSSA